MNYSSAVISTVAKAYGFKLLFMSKVKMDTATLQRKFRRKRRSDGTLSFTMRNNFRLIALLVLLIQFQGLVVVSSIECRLELSPVKVTFEYTEYEYDGMTEAGDHNNTHKKDDTENRNLRALNKEIINSLMSQSERQKEIKWKFLDGSETSLDMTNSSTERLEFLVRRCLCDEVSHNTFCPLNNNANACTVPKNASDTLCYRNSQELIFVAKIWPVVIVWYGAIFLFLIATAHGRNVRSFIMSKFISNWNDEAIDRIIRRETRVRNLLRNGHLINRIGEESADRYDPNHKRFLVLRTKRYCSSKSTSEKNVTSNLNGGTIGSGYSTPDSEYEHTNGSEKVTTKSETTAPSHLTKPTKQHRAHEHGLKGNGECASNHGASDDGEDKGFNSENDVCDDEYYKDKLVCSICIMEVKDGDRIGALPCDHSFHVECLKEWIKRKNVCPLCQESNIASMRREPITSTEGVVENFNADNADNTDHRASSTNREAPREFVQSSLFPTILSRVDTMRSRRMP